MYENKDSGTSVSRFLLIICMCQIQIMKKILRKYVRMFVNHFKIDYGTVNYESYTFRVRY